MFQQLRPGLLILPLIAALVVSCGGDDGPTQLTPQADLVVQAVTSTPAEPIPGQAVTVHATMGNGGDAAAVATRTRVSVDGTATCAEIQTGALAAGATTEVTCAVGPLSLGTHQIEVCADFTGLVAESNEQSNCAMDSLTVVPGPAPANPDLVVRRIYVMPGAPSPTDDITIFGVVANVGNGAAAASRVGFRIAFLLGPGMQVAALAPGDSVTVAYPIGTAATGIFEIESCADINNRIAEANEENNCTVFSLTVN